jgi:DNA topoisomerase-1
VRIIVDREREINAFNSEAYYRITALLCTPDGTGELKAELNTRLHTLAEAEKLLQYLRTAALSIDSVIGKALKKQPAPPLTTSTLQQEAARKLGMPVGRTMSVAQRLYEAGFITYMRTDSLNLSELALSALKSEIIGTQGTEYYKSRRFTTHSKGAQEAHEAIRPTNPARVSVPGTPQEKRLYDLIRKRTIASQMADAEIEKTTVTIAIDGRKEKFVATGEVVKFDGFLRIYKAATEDDEQQEETALLLPPLTAGEVLSYVNITATERFTQHPPRYSEASLVHRLEELGIGRPSTYAPTISTIQQRGYVSKDEREGEQRSYHELTLTPQGLNAIEKTETTGQERGKLQPTDLGIVVNDFLMDAFPEILDYNFTANVEQNFDEVAEGKRIWTGLMDSFYKGFHPLVEQANETRTERRPGERLLGQDPKTGENVFVKIGRYGPVAQMGETNKEGTEKPRFADLGSKLSLETITLEEALELFRLPRTVGTFEDKTVTIGQGRFGPYVLHNKKYVSIPKDKDPLTLTLSEAEQLILAKRKADAEKLIKHWEEEPELQVLNGRFGPYIAYKGSNYKIPKTVVPADLTLEECRALIEKQGTKAPKRGQRTVKAKAAPKAKAKAAPKAKAKTKAKAKS